MPRRLTREQEREIRESLKKGRKPKTKSMPKKSRRASQPSAEKAPPGRVSKRGTARSLLGKGMAGKAASSIRRRQRRMLDI